MSILPIVLSLCVISANANPGVTIYHGSTPAHPEVRDFLGIQREDSIDFIRWRLELDSDQYDLKCQFGLSRGGTNGFIDTREVAFSGRMETQDNLHTLLNGQKTLHMLTINSNLFHLLDQKKNFLVGNGGYSYVLNITRPIRSYEFRVPAKQYAVEDFMVYQGRTPCQELSRMMALDKSTACDKMKWYVILYSDPVTKQPSYYLKGGRGYKKATMERGKWEITQEKSGRIVYKLDPEKKRAATYLLKADANILFFTDPDGNLLVGNENFSYTLNRTTDLEPR